VANKLKKGIFLAFEGPEGGGKSTQTELISGHLMSEGYDICRTAEPGATRLGEKIRDILLEKDDIRLGSLAELFLFEADRAQHLEEVIIPALEDKKIVVCDRFNTATFAYQGYGLGLGLDLIRAVDDIARNMTVPDMTIIFDVDVGTGMQRAASRGKIDRMEKRDHDFHARVRKGYLDMASKEPGRMKVIKTSLGIEETHEEVKKEVYALIERCNRPE
jgi:dTMP kinase